MTVKCSKQGEALLSQADIIARLERYFGKEVSNLKKYQMLLPQSFHIVRPEDRSTTLSKAGILKYQSKTGSLLYFVKYSRINIANAVWELSKATDKATEGHMKELLCCIKYVLDTKNQKLKYQLSRWDKIEIAGICDSDYAGDPESRRSVTGYLVYVNRCSIAWRSR